MITGRSTLPGISPPHASGSGSLSQSMGVAGSSADNALAESFNAALKREILQDQHSY